MSRQQYLNSIKQGAIQGWHEHKILPSITGAQAALESGWGSSKLSKPPYNNNFGIKASADWTGQKIAMQTQEFVNGRTITISADFRAYSSIGESIKDHGAFFTNTPWRVNNYRNVVGERDYKRAAQALQTSGYATDPNYASKILNIIEGNNLVSWDKEAFAGNTVTNLVENKNNKNEKVVGGSLTSAAQSDTEDHTLTVIGDSLGVGTESHLKKYTWAKANYDNYGSRQWTHATAVYNAMGVLQNMASAGTLNKNVVFILGTNRGVTSEEINQAVGICGRDRNIILVDTASEVNHKNTVSKMYKQASQQHDNVYYANWSEKARPNMSKYYHNDGANGTRIHMTSEGYKAHAEFIVQAIYQANATNWSQAINTVTPKDKDYVDIFEIDYNDDKFSSPQGDSSIYNVELNNQFGFKPKKGQVMWIERVYDGSEDNTSDLLANAIKYMEEHSLPGVQYTVSMRYLPDDISIGDTGLFIDHDFNPPLYIKARVLSISTSESNPSSDSVVIGNVVELFPTDKSDLLSIQRELQETREDLISEYFDAKPIRVEISSTNGLSFGARTSTAGYNLVKDASRSISIVDGQAVVDIAKVKTPKAKFKLHGKIENNYIDSVEDLANEIQADKEEVFTGPIDEDSNPQGEAEPNPLDNIDIRQLKVNNFDIQFLNSTGNILYQRNIIVYEDSTFLHELDNVNPDVAQIKITSSRDFKFENINLIEPEIVKDKDVHKTKLEAKVYVEDEEITHNYNSYSWIRISNNPRLDENWNDKNKWNQTNKIDISLEDIDSEAASFLCKVFDEKGEFVTANSASITITQEGNKNTISRPDAPPSDPYPGDKWTAVDGDLEEEYHYVDGEWVQTGVSKKVEIAITEAEQAKEDAQKAFDDAVAEAERLVIETDVVWQGKMKEYDEQVALIDASAKEAQTKADQALIDVGISTDLAQTAKDLADTAKTNAQTAISNANQAKADAQTAVTQAGQAIASANTAKTNAQTAINNAQSALTEAGNAKTTANSLSVKVDDLEGEVELKASQTEVDGISGTVSTHATTLGQHATQIASKASSQLVNTIKGTVDTHSTEISQNAKDIASKASSSSVNALTGRVSTAETSISQNATAITSKASTSSVNTLTGRVSTAETTLTQHATSIASKASQTEVDTVKGTVSNHTSTLSQHASQISARLTSSQVNSLVDGKGLAKTTYVDTQITAKAGEITTSLTSLINTKATKSDINTSILNDKRVKDTRNDNQLPSWYNTNYPRQTVTEFKTTSAMGITGGSTYGLLTTEVIWNHTSGGTIKQTLKDNTDTYTRQSNTAYTAWGPWVKMADQTYVNTTVTATANGIEQIITQVKNNPTGTITGYNSLKNNVDSMVQAIGSDGGKIAQMVMTDSVFKTTVANLDIMARVGTGQQLYSDPLFEKGMNGIGVYNNSGGTHVTITRESASGDPTPTNNRLKIVTNGSTVTPSWGGIIRNTTGRVKAEYVVMFTALLPKGRSFQYAQNPLGTGFTSKWLTSPEGTGDWAEYAYYYKCGTGTVSSFGHLYVQGGATPTATAPLTWYLAKHETYDISGSFQTQVTQLADSWALTLKSGNDIKTQINASTNAIRLQSKFIHLNGSSLIDNATIKSAHIDTLNANKITGNTADFNKVRAGVLTADVVTSTHIKADNALIDTIFATSALIGRLTSKTAFINSIKAIDISADKISGGTLTGTTFITTESSTGFSTRLSNGTIEFKHQTFSLGNINATVNGSTGNVNGFAVVQRPGYIFSINSRSNLPGNNSSHAVVQVPADSTGENRKLNISANGGLRISSDILDLNSNMIIAKKPLQINGLAASHAQTDAGAKIGDAGNLMYSIDKAGSVMIHRLMVRSKAGSWPNSGIALYEDGRVAVVVKGVWKQL